MREVYILGSLLLGAAAVFGTMSVVRYDHSPSVKIEKDISFKEKEVKEEPSAEEPELQDSTPIYAKNGFDKYRGEEQPTEEVADEEAPVVPQGNFEFELQAIHILGEKKLALIAAKPIRSSRSYRGRSSSSSRTPVSSSSTVEAKLVKLGEEIEGTGHVVESIEPGLVKIKGSSGISQSLPFSLSSESSLKRAEVAFKNELGRQKNFAKQNAFSGPKTTTTAGRQQTPQVGKPKSVQDREAEMRKRAELLKISMRRLKEQDKKEAESKKTGSSSSDKSKYEKFKRR